MLDRIDDAPLCRFLQTRELAALLLGSELLLDGGEQMRLLDRIGSAERAEVLGPRVATPPSEHRDERQTTRPKQLLIA